MEKPPQAARPEQENFGEASLGEAQSSNPPEDPEMIRGESEEEDQETSDDEAADTGEGVVPPAEGEPGGEDAEG